MEKQSNSWLIAALQKRRVLIIILVPFSFSTVIIFLVRFAFDSCYCTSRRTDYSSNHPIHGTTSADTVIEENPLAFMKSKLVLLVSHELSLSGGPLLLMELAFFLEELEQKLFGLQIKPDEVSYNL